MLRLLAATACCVGAAAAAASPAPLTPCGPPPQVPYPRVSALPNCSSFPDPFLRPDGTAVKTPAEWSGGHRKDMISLLEHYMYGHAPEPPPVRSSLTATGDRTEFCERVHFGCNHNPNEMNVTGCDMRCLPLKTPQTLRNYTLRVGPTADKTWPFDVFVWTPKDSKAPLPFVIYNGEGFFSGVEYGDLTAEGAKVLLDHGFGLAVFNRNQLRKDHKTGGCAAAGCSMGDPDGVQTVYPDNTWSTISVWAWGAARVVDFLLEDKDLSPLVDPKKLMTMVSQVADQHPSVDSRTVSDSTVALAPGALTRRQDGAVARRAGRACGDRIPSHVRLLRQRRHPHPDTQNRWRRRRLAVRLRHQHGVSL